MEQTAVTDEPDVRMMTGDDVGDPANELPIVVFSVVGKLSGPGIELVEPAVRHTQPDVTAVILGDGLHVGTAESVRVLGIVKIPGDAFAPRIKSVRSIVRRNPQAALIVFEEILNEIGTQTRRIVRVVLVDHERVAVIPVESVPRAEPHEPAAILDERRHITLRQSVACGEMGESEIPPRSVPAPSGAESTSRRRGLGERPLGTAACRNNDD